MATERLPSYVNVRQLADGQRAYYWVRPNWARPPAERFGRQCPYVTTALGTDTADAIKRAEAINIGFREWRLGVDARPAEGSVRWLFMWYREQERYTKVRHKTRKEYRALMDAIADAPMKQGTFGDRQARVIDAAAADKLYAKLKPRGERQAAYMMSLCRTVWGWAARHSAKTGVKENPFAGMGIRSKPVKGNRPTSRAEYDAYRAKAREMGYQSMATAAALAFEACQRVWDVFGFVDEDGRFERGIRWDGYQPGVMLRLVQSKTGNVVEIPLSDVDDHGNAVVLYPEMEEELDRSGPPVAGELIVRDERSGQPYKLDWMQKLHRKIRIAADLPDGMTFTGFRHGGLTEIGDSGEADVRAISGHATLQVTSIYNKASQEKAKRIAVKRRAHVASNRPAEAGKGGDGAQPNEPGMSKRVSKRVSKRQAASS